ncbi:FAD:protein FMN transferase [Oceanobacillus halophilus]|uniref:FAD:protein FMN transferase n=1 Tax=Oceanobacillus halophilus TaxID=930130 RepID=A0A494ZTY5_9BACI|nr:FAD:protein FMN transferase [Oceanobacillus halophilus]RKQ29350.1 FAD:protein FMN transferase [Oceanobacillus halophilus]
MDRKETKLHMMGTIIDLMVDSKSSTSLIEQLTNDLAIYEKRFNANDPQSELMAIHHQAGVAPVPVDDALYELIAIGKAHSLEHPSYLNIALGPLIKAWHIGFDDAKKPSDKVITETLKLTQPHLIELCTSDQSVFLPKKGMEIDLGALAKGYIADRIISTCRNHAVKTAYINLGGNFLSYGPSANRSSGYYRIGIQDPIKPRGHYVLAVDTFNQSVVTSGIYERQLKQSDKTYHHIFDPKTGYPVETDIVSLTIISKTSLEGEIWTTRLFGLTSKDALSFVNNLTNIESIIITKDQQVHISEGLRDRIVPLNRSIS